MQLDVAKYEIFAHRLFNVLEEGRIAMAQVSGSPVVVEGGETMCAFYTPEGDAFMTGAGILLHVTGASDFVKETIRLYREDPGIFEEDQFLWNDPYLGGQHTLDQIIVKPIFYNGNIVAWVSSFMHTPEVGAIDPTGTCPSATEIYHEGIRAFGLKIVDRGHFRKDIYNTVTLNTRDPDLVGLDHKAKIAANNVCARMFLEMVDSFGIDFVRQASKKLIEDAELAARARLARLPDGIWKARLFGDSDGLNQRPFQVVCTLTKKGDSLTLDYTGTSEQNPGSLNAAWPALEGRLYAVLVSNLFWGLTWNAGTVKPVRIIAPEGTVVNARYPAAVSNAASGMGGLMGEPAHECIAKMLYAAGEEFYGDVLAGFSGSSQHSFWAGEQADGQPFLATTLDHFAGGLGAAPDHDGVDTGGKMITPAATIIDVEMFEQRYPILYLFRRQAEDNYGAGMYRGGMGGEAAYMIYGGKRVKMGAHGCGTQTAISFGLFGGYPAPPSRTFALLNSQLESMIRSGQVPINGSQLEQVPGVLKELDSNEIPFDVRTWDVVCNRWLGGGGFGDPLKRSLQQIEEDVRQQVLSPEAAAALYGVRMVLKDGRWSVDEPETRRLREQIRQERLEASAPPLKSSQLRNGGFVPSMARRVMDEVDLVIDESGNGCFICRSCGYVLGSAEENYKHYARVRRFDPCSRLPLRSPRGEFAEYWEFYCPGCVGLLAVDPMMPGEEEPIWDLQLDTSTIVRKSLHLQDAGGNEVA